MAKLVAKTAFVPSELFAADRASIVDIFNFSFSGTTSTTKGIGNLEFRGPFDTTIPGEEITGFRFVDFDLNEIATLSNYRRLTESNIGKVFSDGTVEGALKKLLSGADKTILSNENDDVSGYGGKDKIIGRGGNDVLAGDAGNDKLAGGADKDRLFGDSGNDTLDGGTGKDHLTGGSGRDTFVFAGKSGRDTIHDFTDGKDKIQIRAADTIGDLDIAQNGNHVIISFEQSVIVVRNHEVADVTASDFLF